MEMAGKYWWLKERCNPQLGKYWVKCGRITVKEARKKEDSSYGDNYMHKFNSEEEYAATVDELNSNGERVVEGL
jgi:hypothetical protein